MGGARTPTQERKGPGAGVASARPLSTRALAGVCYRVCPVGVPR
jgi:hypothetical protein